MPQLQKESQKITIAQFAKQLPGVLISVIEDRQPLGFYIQVGSYPSNLVELSLKSVQKKLPKDPTRTIGSYKKLSTGHDPESKYEMKQRAWRRKLFQETSGAIKDTEKLDKELKARRISETAASKRLAKW